MKKANKILSIILAMLMVISIIPITASAAEPTSGTCGDNVTWSYDKTTCTLTISGSGEMYNYNFSNRPWEDYEDEIKTVIVSDGITLIGNYSFYHFDVLVSATLPNDLKMIGNSAFCNSKKLTDINIPDSVTEIGDNAFRYCLLGENITIHENVKTVGEYAFASCNGIKNLIICNGETALDSNVFSDCDNLTSVTLPNNITEIPFATFSSCTGLANITLPDSIIRVGQMAFYDTAYYNDESNWENGVLYLDEYLLRADSDSLSGECKIKEGTELIADWAFSQCKNLASVNIPESVKIIGNQSFVYCHKLTDITVDEGNQYFTNDEYGVLFNKDKTELIQYPIGNTRTDYIIPGSVTKIGSSSFLECDALTSVVLPNSLKIIEGSAFSSCSGITNITIPDGVTEIGEWAFRACDNLETITIPNSVTTIGEYVLSYTTTIIYYCGTKEQWKLLLANNPDAEKELKKYTVYCSGEILLPTGKCGDNLTWTYDNTNEVLTISGTGEMYDFEYIVHWDESNTPWSAYVEYIKKIIIEDGVTSIGDYAFYRCSNLSDVVFGGDLTTIGEGAFQYCTGLNTVTIGKNVITIDEYAFAGCKNIKSVIMPFSVTAMESTAFNGCNNITDVYYEGTQDDWTYNFIISFGGNAPITIKNPFPNASIHYNYGKFTGIKDNHIYINDVMQKAYQLVEVDGNFYYIGDRHEIVKDKKVYIKAERTNDLTFADGTPITAGWYEFDENGKMVIVNGIVGNKIYKNNTQLKAYQLVEVDGDFYYIGDRHEIVKNKKVYIKAERLNDLTYADGKPIQAGYYTFDENGKMIILDGIVGNKVFKNNVQLKAYQLVEVNGDFYYIGDRHEIVKDKRVYVKAERTNDLTYANGTLIQAGWYNFDADGKMIVE